MWDYREKEKTGFKDLFVMVLGIKHPASLAQNRSLVVISTKTFFVSLLSSI